MRRKVVNLKRKSYLTNEVRLADLEADLLRVIEFSMDLEDRLFRQERYLNRLIRLLQASGVSSSEGKEKVD